MPDQLPLFEPPPPSAGPAGASSAALEARFAALRETAARLPAFVRLGTSSWSFPGWRGIVYASERTTAALARDGLREYARHPLLTTVGIDRSYYSPIPDEDFHRYADQLPAGFPCCCKAPARVTSPVLPERGSSEPNPGFLSPDAFVEDLLDPVSRAFSGHGGPFILQFPPMLRRAALPASDFVDGLDRFLDALPKDFCYAVELRDRALLTGPYVRVLARHGVAHVYNSWTAMPPPGEQAAALPVEEMPFLVIRWLMKPGTTYEDQRAAFLPFDRLCAPDERMRNQVVDLVARAVARAIPAYVLVNNKAEGSSPLTIEALARRLAELRAGGGQPGQP
jgi:uncharacterized protein YecE (DUF72 family)